MPATKQPIKFFVSQFPSGRWVGTGHGPSILTSGSTLEESKAFLRENGMSPEDVVLTRHWRHEWFEEVSLLKEDGDLLYTDRGTRISFDREQVSDDEIRVALASAKSKFSEPLTLTSECPIFLGRMAGLAKDMNIKVSNPPICPSTNDDLLDKKK
jgi:hypothetical protein